MAWPGGVGRLSSHELNDVFLDGGEPGQKELVGL